MKKFGMALALLGFMMQAHAIQEVKLQEVPPLKPLHWCKHTDGQTTSQIDPCGSDTTEVSSISQRQPDGRMEFEPLHKEDTSAASQSNANEQASASSQAAASSPSDSKQVMKEFRMRMLKWLGFALAVAVIAKLLNRSFILWFVIGFVLRMVLVAANVIAF